MTLYRKVFTKDRLPESEGTYIVGYEYGSFSCYYNKQYSFHEESTDCTIIEWWLEEISLIDEKPMAKSSKFMKDKWPYEAGLNDGFEDDANYILNKLKG